jgi:hypothetical protein
MSGYLSAARKGPVFTAEKCLEIARNLEAKGNKKMAYLWALRAAKAAQNEKKSAIRRQAEEMASRLKAEMAKEAAANVVNGLISGEDCGRFSCMGQLSPKTIALVDSLAPKMLNRPGGVHELFVGIVALHIAKEIAMEQQHKKAVSVAARMIRAAKMAKLAKELGLS